MLNCPCQKVKDLVETIFRGKKALELPREYLEYVCKK
jgi:hypothetical protein